MEIFGNVIIMERQKLNLGIP